MTTRVLFAGLSDRWPTYEPLLKAELAKAGVEATVAPDLGPPDTVDYIVYAPDSELQDFTAYSRCKAVLNLWAGVEEITGNPTLKIPLARMVDEGLTAGMVEWVVGHVMRHHLGMDPQIRKAGGWDDLSRVPPLAKDRSVVILGLGALGAACGAALAGLGFPVTGWSRTARTLPDLDCLSGATGLQTALSRADILVLLLPLTDATQNLLNAEAIATLPKGAIVVNPARGPIIEDEALIAALDSGHLSHATLDVFREEPLPGTHPFWSHPKVTVTPHIASQTREDTAAVVIAENIRRGEAGEPFLHLVDRDLGY